MRATPLLLALSLAAAASPVVLSAHPSAPADQTNPAGDKAKGPKGDEPRPGEAKGPRHEKPRPAKAKGPKGTNYLLHACVLSPPEPETETEAVVKTLLVKPLRGNRHMRRALKLSDDSPNFTATLDDKTFFRLVGKARPKGVRGKEAGIGAFDDVNAGDRVTIRFWAKRSSDLDGVAAWRVIDRGPSKKCPLPESESDPQPSPADETPGL